MRDNPDEHDAPDSPIEAISGLKQPLPLAWMLIAALMSLLALLSFDVPLGF